MLDLTGETEKENLKELVLLQKLVNEKGKSLSVEESRKIQMQMENITNQRSKLTDMAYLMLFPEAEHAIKPLDEELVVAAAKETGKVVTVEEHSVIGGLGGAVCECLSEKAPVPVKRIGVNDVFGESGPATALLEKYGLDAEGIYKQIKEFV